MNTSERIKMIKCMEFICRNLNDEDDIYAWLVNGIADGDIEYGDLDVNESSKEDLEYYLEDENFKDLMTTFLSIMKHASRSNGGGLYCDNVVA